tara:strand:+ start:91 stop:228 length:138 start_codon:yes stop_codon:yes gene_type:complete
MSNKKLTIDQRIKALKEQLKQMESTYLKVQGAIEMLEGMKEEGLN